MWVDPNEMFPHRQIHKSKIVYFSKIRRDIQVSAWDSLWERFVEVPSGDKIILDLSRDEEKENVGEFGNMRQPGLRQNVSVLEKTVVPHTQHTPVFRNLRLTRRRIMYSMDLRCRLPQPPAGHAMSATIPHRQQSRTVQCYNRGQTGAEVCCVVMMTYGCEGLVPLEVSPSKFNITKSLYKFAG